MHSCLYHRYFNVYTLIMVVEYTLIFSSSITLTVKNGYKLRFNLMRYFSWVPSDWFISIEKSSTRLDSERHPFHAVEFDILMWWFAYEIWNSIHLEIICLLSPLDWHTYSLTRGTFRGEYAEPPVPLHEIYLPSSDIPGPALTWVLTTSTDDVTF